MSWTFFWAVFATGFLVCPAVIGVTVIAIDRLWPVVTGRETVITCRCGKSFGHEETNEYVYDYQDIPVYKRHKGSLNLFTNWRFRLHWWTNCPSK